MLSIGHLEGVSILAPVDRHLSGDMFVTYQRGSKQRVVIGSVIFLFFLSPHLLLWCLRLVFIAIMVGDW